MCLYSTIQQSFNCCITIHGTNHVRLEGNVTYEAIGHCFYLEEGDEIGNYNLSPDFTVEGLQFTSVEQRVYIDPRPPVELNTQQYAMVRWFDKEQFSLKKIEL